MTSVDVLQKLLLGPRADAVLAAGSASVGGLVVRAADVTDLTTPTALLDAHGLRGRVDDRTTVHVVRFPVVPLMRLGRPPGDGLGASHPTGFLDGHPAPVWWLERTRFPRGAELWRITEDGGQDVVTVYDGAARGWRGARQYVPPRPFVGPRAVLGGTEYGADVAEDGRAVTLVAVGEVPDGFRSTRPMISERTVPVEECESVFERVLTCTWRGARWRVLDRDDTTARLLLLDPEDDQVARLDPAEVEPGVLEATAPLAELTDAAGHEEVLSPR